MPGAIWTTLQNAEKVDANLYDFKEQVFLNGGPVGGGPGLPDGEYYFQVTDPSGEVLLSSDAIECRRVLISGGRIAGALPGPGGCQHANGIPTAKGLPVQLVPYDDTPNGGGEYKVWITPVGEYVAGTCNWGFCGSQKTDNFKVRKIQPAYVVACKFNDLDGFGTLDEGEPVIAGWPFTATGVDGGTVTTQTGENGCVSFTVSNPGSGQLITLAEGTIGDLWFQTAPADGPRDRSGTSPAYVVVGGVASTNDLKGGDEWKVDFGNYNANCPGNSCNPPSCLTNPTPDCVGLLVTKTAHPHYKMTWTLNKTGNTDPIYTGADGKATASYTVTATHGSGTDFAVSGEITVANETIVDAFDVTVTDVMGGGWNCFVKNGTGITVPASSSVTLQYRCINGSLSGPPSELLTNTATATWNGGSNSASGVAENINFATATVVDGEVNVTDPAAPGDHICKSADSGNSCTFTYEVQWPGTPGVCVEKVNVATLTSTTPNTRMTPITDDHTVTVCSANDPVVTKTANPTFKRTYKWQIEKLVDATQKNISGGTATFDYTAKVTQLPSVDSDWAVTGTITVTNSNDFPPGGMLVNVTDQLPGANCTVDSPTLTVPARVGEVIGTASTNYSCTFSSTPGTSPNTGTATWNQATYHTPSGTASGTAAVAFTTPTTVVDKVITVKDVFNGGDPVTLGEVTATDPPGSPTLFNYSKTVGGTPGTCVDYPNTASFKSNTTDTSGSASQTVKVCQGADLSVSKTANPFFKRSYTWNLTKVVNNQQTPYKTNGSDVTVSYTVTATQTGQQDSDWRVTGMITITNPNDWQDVVVNLADSTNNGSGACNINNGTPTVTVPKKVGSTNGSVTVPYRCNYASAPTASDWINTATATWSGAFTTGTSATGTASGNFNTPTTTADKTIDVKDAFDGGTAALLFSVTATDPPAAPASGSQTYTRTINAEAGQCRTYPNVATFKSTDSELSGSAPASVEVCRGANLTVSKTVNTTYSRTYNWSVAKSVDKTRVEMAAGGTATFNYTVTATQTSFQDTNIGASGTITVTNPNTWQSVSVTVSDAIVGGPSCTITEGAGPHSVAASGSITLNYTCAPTSTTEFTNQVTAEWNGAAAYTPGSSASNTAGATFGAPASTTNASLTVTDNWNGEGAQTLGTMTAVDSGLPVSANFPYSKSVSGVGGTCTTYNNTATITSGQANLGSDSESVVVCVGNNVTVSKNAIPAYKRVYYWSISKSVDSDMLVAGGNANYTVVVTQTDAKDGEWEVQGNITVTNPNDWQSITLNLSDAIDNGGACDVNGSSSGVIVTLAAGGSATMPYICRYSAPPSSAAFTNTATASVTSGVVPNSTKTGTASGAFGAPSEIKNQTVTVTDTMQGMLGTVTGTDPAPFASRTFTYARFIQAPEGGCTVVDNTATIVETGQQASAQTSACDLAGHTMGFWHNKNGQKMIDGANQTHLGNWLRQFYAFADAPVGGSGLIGDWALGVIDLASCGGASCIPMLKAQMLATALGVYFSDDDLGGNKLKQPADLGGATISLINPDDISAAFGGATSMTIMDMLLYQNRPEVWNGGLWYAGNKTLQTKAKTGFDNINNGEMVGP